MRKLLVTAVALAPLALAAEAHAQTNVDSTRSTPVETAGEDVRVTSTGGFDMDGGVAITLNSDNDVTVDSGGDIIMLESDSGSTAILAEGGNSGSIDYDGTIRLTDKLTEFEDDDDDGDLDGPVSEGLNRYGIRVAGPGPLDGDIDLDFGSSITIEGDESAGVLIGSGLTGDLFSATVVNVVGTDSYGIRTTGAIEGDARIGGTIAARGQDTVGIAFDGDVEGQVLIDGTVSTTGFRFNSRPAADILANLDEDDLRLGGATVRIGGNVGSGVVLDVATEQTDSDDDDDEDDLDGDGIIDSQETDANLTSTGSAPALLIGSGSQTVTLGVAGSGDEAYGLINRGSVVGAGLFDGFSATGARIGGAGAQDVLVEGGVLNEGSISGTAAQAASFGLIVGDGATTPALVNSGSITAQTVSDAVLNASALRIESGADMATLRNSGRIEAVVNGERGNAIAVSDRSGTLSDIENSGRIIGALSRTIGENQDGSEPITGRGVALDLSANTSGVSLVQFGEQADEDSEAADADGDGVSDIDEPIIRGDVLLGSGADVIDIRNGELTGAINFGAGADTLRISGGASVAGAIVNSDGLLQIDIDDGNLNARQTAPTTISGLNVGSDGALLITIDPDVENNEAGFDVEGLARFENGAELGVRFDRLIEAPGRYSVVRADVLDFGDIDDASISENSPYLFVVEDPEVVGNELFIEVRQITAAEADLNAAEAGAFGAVYQALDDDEEILAAFLSQTTRQGFIELYEQMLPDHSGGPLLALASGVDAVTRALSGRNQTPAPGETSAWLQEINFYAEKDQDQAYGFQSEGVGVAGGVERGTRLGAFGLSTAFTSTDLEDNHAQAEELLSVSLIELGLYWRAQGGAWTTWARAAGGYTWLEARREFVGAGLFRSNESEWDGYTVAAAIGASYERTYGRYSFRPEITAEYFSLTEEARTESGGGDGFDLAIDDRDGHLFAATAVMNFGVGLGRNNWLRPELRVGWRQNISFDGGVTTGRFLSGGPDFVLPSDSIEGGGPVVGFRMNIGDQLGFLSIEGDAEFIDDYVRYALLLRASFRF